MSILGGESVWGFFLGVIIGDGKCMTADRIMAVIAVGQLWPAQVG